MVMHFLFPEHPFEPKTVEETFAGQFVALREQGFSLSLCSDAVLRDGRPLRGIPSGTTVVYRGWMMNGAEYNRLAEAIGEASATPLTSPVAYLAAHHLPNWYPLIAEFTPETRVLPLTADFEAELRSLGWDAFFIKDYVKSLKTSRGSMIRDPSQIGGVMAEMEHFRGEIEGGLCVRRVESFIRDSEQRYFILRGVPFIAGGGSVPDLVREIADRIPSPFFSVDVIRRADGVLRVVEIGDGQVSDLVGWSPDEFAAIWRAVSAIK